MTLKDNYVFCNLFYKQTLCKKAGIEKKVRESDHDLLVIFENLAATLRITLRKTESTWGSLNRILAICAVLRTVTVKKACNEVKMGNSLQQYRLIVGMYSVYLVAKEFRGCFQGEILVFCLTFVLLRGHIFASIETFGSYLWNVTNELPMTYTDLFVSLFSWHLHSSNILSA